MSAHNRIISAILIYALVFYITVIHIYIEWQRMVDFTTPVKIYFNLHQLVNILFIHES